MTESCSTKYVEARDLQTKTVIVYADRAEVKRIVKLELDQGRNNVIVQNVSSVIEHQSIKVDGRGTTVIQDVQYMEQYVDVVEKRDDEVSKLEEEKTQLESKKADAEDAIHVLKKRLEILDGVACQIGQNVNISHEQKQVPANQAFLLCNEAMQNLTTFLDYYGKTASDLKQELRNCEKQVRELKDRIDCVERNIDQLRCRFEYDNHKRSISIIVDVAEAGLTELSLSYQVYCVSWKPTYDIRASTSGIDSSAANKIKVLYYGLIEQKSDEDWRDAELVLSTATPCVAGTVPTLPTLNAAFQRQAPSVVRLRNASAARRKPNSNGSEEDMGFGSFDYNEFTDAAALQRMTIAYTASDHEHSLGQNYEHLPCTCFSIEAPATILSDGLSHKVQIASLEFDPVFTHETVPSKTASAFLTAVVVNNSALPLLPGSASVYLNNSFISTTSLKSILPGEEFKCPLGIDPSVKVEYKPCVRSNEQVGFMTKSSLCTHEQVVSLRNAKALQNAVLTVREPIPKAVDEKIKIFRPRAVM
uniref:Protein F37C4.5 n=1 Tax=Panagrellus redivivus TaxID=6233 RepID=A0A7E4V2Y9_PANRE